MQKIPIKEKRNQSTKKKYNKRPNSKSHTANKDYYQKGNNQKKNKDGYYNNLVNEILSVDGSRSKSTRSKRSLTSLLRF